MSSPPASLLSLPYSLRLQIALSSPGVWSLLLSTDRKLWHLVRSSSSLQEVARRTLSLRVGGCFEKYFVLPDGTRHGSCKIYSPDGKLRVRRTFSEGHLSGRETIFYRGTRTIHIRRNYQMGARSGREEIFDPDGTLRSRKEFRRGLGHGKEEIFYRTGALFSRSFFLRDKKNGPNELFYPNGLLKQRSFYLDDHLSGLCQDFSTEGELLSSRSYVQGVLRE